MFRPPSVPGYTFCPISIIVPNPLPHGGKLGTIYGGDDNLAGRSKNIKQLKRFKELIGALQGEV